MPLLDPEPDLYPADLLQHPPAADLPATGSPDEELPNEESPRPAAEQDRRWWAMYTRSRCEKQLMRNLHKRGIAFYGPTYPRRYRSPSGRQRTCYELLFANYVFVYADDYEAFQAMTDRSVSRRIDVPDGERLGNDLRMIYRLIHSGCPLTRESRLQSGDRVRVRSGALAGFEGTVIRRQQESRLLISVSFTNQGASFQVDECQLEVLN